MFALRLALVALLCSVGLSAQTVPSLPYPPLQPSGPNPETVVGLSLLYPPPNTTVTLPTSGLLTLVALSTAPRVDFYVSGVLVRSVAPGLVQQAILDRYRTGTYFYGAQVMLTTVGVPLTVTAYSCASVTACTGKARLQASTVYNVTLVKP